MLLKVKIGVIRGLFERTPPFRNLALYPIELRALFTYPSLLQLLTEIQKINDSTIVPLYLLFNTYCKE